MPWFKIDDSAHSHPKFIRAGNAALGLWLRCGAYSAQHLLEGRVPKSIVKAFGTPAQVKKLIEAGLWHAPDHDCSRCPQPASGDYLMHDFFEGGRNSTKAQVEAARKGAADRQAKSRARGADTKRIVNGARNETLRDSNGAQSEPYFQGSTAGQGGLSQRDAMEGVTPSHAMPFKSLQAGRPEGVPQQGVQTPDWAQPLIDKLDSKGIRVSWARLSNFQLLGIQELINKRGIDSLVATAVSRWNPRDPIKFASLLLTIWLEYPDATPGSQQRSSRPTDLPNWCKDPDCDEQSRTHEVEDDRGLRTLQRCPDCHPASKGHAA